MGTISPVIKIQGSSEKKNPRKGGMVFSGLPCIGHNHKSLSRCEHLSERMKKEIQNSLNVGQRLVQCFNNNTGGRGGEASHPDM